jgi:16S rRNA (cytosine967-C5)-methyltransferase
MGGSRFSRRQPELPTAESLALDVLSEASRQRPAEAVLRDKLKKSKNIAPDIAREVVRRVSVWARWRAWLKPASHLERQMLEAMELADRFATNPRSFTNEDLRRAVPDWVHEEIPASPGWWRTLQEDPAPLWLRARPGTAADLARELLDSDPADGVATDALRYLGTTDLFHTPAFKEGRFEVQDLASQLVSKIAAPQPGETWWDACAGEGGKTMHLADLMENRGVIWASDRAAWRLAHLRRRAGRAGRFNIRWGLWDPLPSTDIENPTREIPKSSQPAAPAKPDATPIDPLPRGLRFDGVLVDAPCSGLGTWQRHPHARWTTTQVDVAELAAKQLALLRAAAERVQSGGTLTYAVCTLTRSETRSVSEAFLSQCPQFEPLPIPAEFQRGAPKEHPHESWIWPQDWNCTGMFVARWRRRTED